MNQGNWTPAMADEVEIDLEKNDPRLWETKEDGSCTLYSLFYVIYWSVYLKDLFHSNVRKDTENYYFYLRVLGNWYTFRIPIEVIMEEKANDKSKIYPTDMELLLAISILCHVVMFLKYVFIDRLAFQPFIETDLFFDHPFVYIGEKTDIERIAGDHLRLKTDIHEIDLAPDGVITFEDGKKWKGHYIFTIGYYPKGFSFGHSISVYFDFELKQWLYYSTRNDPKYGIVGERILSDIVPIHFNGLSMLSGVE